MNALFMLRVVAMLAAGCLAADAPAGEKDLTKIKGPDACEECHKDEVKVWKETKHAKTFTELTQNKDAKKIAEKMEVKRIKSDSLCMNCHFTNEKKDAELKAIAGVSCESCHGPSRDWVDTHGDYGGKGVKKEQESPEHKAQREKQIAQSDMILPKDIYALASNCYECHLVPKEKLVNVGEHTAGSKFELVSWSQGDVRHNFYRSASGKDNELSSPPRKRLLYVIGQALDLEHSLRGVSKATEKATYAVQMAKRVKAAVERLKAVDAQVSMPEVKEMVTAGDAADLKLNNEANLKAAADKVAAAAKKFVGQYDGSTLAAIDSLLPGESQYKRNTDKTEIIR